MEQDVETWAERLLGRDDLAIDIQHEDDLKPALFELSTLRPMAQCRRLADRWLARLTTRD